MRVWGKVTLEAILFWCQGFNSFQETEIQKLEWMAQKKKKKSKIHRANLLIFVESVLVVITKLTWRWALALSHVT